MVIVSRNPRAGYALLATLWICVGIGGLTWLISVSARETLAASRNRMALTRAGWDAQACVAYVRDGLRDALARDAAARWDSAAALWHHVDRVIGSGRQLVPGCTLSARAAGSRLDVNRSDESSLARVLANAGMRPAQADSAAAAISDWIDADDQPRAAGAERTWYEARDRVPPSNAPFVDRREIRRVRGLETFTRLDSVLDVEPGPLALNQMPRELLALLPGFTERTIREVIDARDRGTPIMSFHALGALLSPDAPDASAKLPGLVLLLPNAWIITARAQSGTPPVTVVAEVRVARAGGTTVITRRRSWIE